MHIRRTTDNSPPTADQWTLPKPSGITVCYEEPLNNLLLSRISKSLQTNHQPNQYYRLISDCGFLEELYPISSHYSLTATDISKKMHSADLCLRSISSQVTEISRSYAQRKSETRNGQPKLVFGDELHVLRSEYAALLFLIRSSLDQFATCVVYLLNLRRSPHRSFAALIKEAKSEKTELPSTLIDVLLRNEEWFLKMRDVRDYIAHLGFLRISIWETSPDTVQLCIHHRIDLLGSAHYFLTSTKLLYESLDRTLSDQISNA